MTGVLEEVELSMLRERVVKLETTLEHMHDRHERDTIGLMAAFADHRSWVERTLEGLRGEVAGLAGQISGVHGLLVRALTHLETMSPGVSKLVTRADDELVARTRRRGWFRR